MGEKVDDEDEILKQVFGDSSDDEDFEEQPVMEDSAYEVGRIHGWEQVKDIKGLWLCRSFISPEQESSLLSEIRNEGWFMEASQNQAMRFGNLPTWAVEISDSIHEAVLSSNHMTDPFIVDRCNGDKIDCPLPSDILWREPLFDQMIANVYQPGEGICAHVDLMRFEDGIAIVSLESPCVMHFTPVDQTSCDPYKQGRRSQYIDVESGGISKPRIACFVVGRSSVPLEARDKSQAWVSNVGRPGTYSGETNLHHTEEAVSC